MSSIAKDKPASQEFGHHTKGLSTELIEALCQAEVMYRELGRTGLITFLEEEYPQMFQIVLEAKDQVPNQGYALIDTGLRDDKRIELAATALAISAVFGYPTETDKVSRAVVWPITPRSVEYSVTTFSEDVGEAAMHTDSQFIENPEDKFLLACINPDSVGNGTSELIDGYGLREWIEKNDPVLNDMLEQEYPFRVPTVFTQQLSDDDPEVVWRPIFESDRIRYRYDTVMSALQLERVNISEAKFNALQRLAQLLDKMPRVRHHLLSGEIIVADNRRMLHARTNFSNRKRLLLRVRMNDEIKI